MTGATIRLPKPHNGQRAILSHPARFKWVSAGRRWRKTTMAMALTVERCLKGETVLWGAPTYDQCRVGLLEMYKAAGGVATFNKSLMEVTFPTGGRVIYRSLDNPDNARGHTSNGIVLDEASKIPESAYYDVLRPVISDTGGWVLAIFTPNGRNWVWRECMGTIDQPSAQYWQVPTLGVEIIDRQLIRKPHPLENPDFPFTEAVNLYQTLPEATFQAEFLAQFLEGQGAVFRYVDERCILQPREPEAGHSYVMGVDWAQSRDYTVLTVLDKQTREMVAIDRFNGIDWALQRGRLRTLYDRYLPDVIIAESNSIGSPNIEALQREGLPVKPFETTGTSKPPLIESLVLAFDRAEIKALNHPVVKGELMAYERKVSATGRSQYSAPEGMHDDCVMSLALAWWGCINAHGADVYVEQVPSFLEI